MQGQTHSAARSNAKVLRRESTEAERVLWQRLRGQQFGVKFRRQHPYLGFVLDFVCIERRMVVEVDGGQHADSMQDARRDAVLAAAGFTVLRFWNNDVLERTEDVAQAIYNALNPSPPQPSP
jgi:very-short-patch-repair endonuclease